MLAADARNETRFNSALTLGGNGAIERLFGQRFQRIRKVADTKLVQWILLGRGPSRTYPGVRPATAADIPVMWELLRNSWQERSFAPVSSLDAFAAEWSRDSSLRIENAIVLERGGRVVGCGALWDQRELKQERVLAYTPVLRAVAAAVRAAATIGGGATLPPAGASIPLAHVRHFAAIDLDAARTVRDALLARARSEGLLIVMLGIDARDPLARIARGRLHVTLPGAMWITGDQSDAELTALVSRPAWVDYSVA